MTHPPDTLPDSVAGGIAPLVDEAHQLVAILTASIRTARQHRS
jgi:hypothetical protein